MNRNEKLQQFDILMVSYNSSKWIDACFTSIKNADYDLNKIHIAVTDNGSTDDTIQKLNQIKKNNWFGSFVVVEAKENLGFGQGNNLASKQGKAPYILCLNIDIEVFKDTFLHLNEQINNSNNEVAMWELRQFPYEHPKLYDPLTRETSWSSGAAFAIRREIYEQIGGFDSHIFMYGEDVDISWRVRMLGKKIIYTPKATLMHYCYTSANEIKPNQYFNSILNNLNLRYKFGSVHDIMEWYWMFFKVMSHVGPFYQSRQGLFKRFFANIKSRKDFKKWHREHRIQLEHFKPNFLKWDYEEIKPGAFHENSFPEAFPLVSILVRTCNRPEMLREALISLRNQTYPNLEVVLVEDGPNGSQSMIEKEFSDLKIQYWHSQEKVGRCVTGNKALELAQGKYCNFLDDDDIFYADHVESLVAQLEKTKTKVAHNLGLESLIEIISKEPYLYNITSMACIHNQKFNRLLLFHHNLFPIQCVMFEKSVYEECGGFDLKLTYLEDWDLWVRYGSKYEFSTVEKASSIYRVTAQKDDFEKRQKELNDAYNYVNNKHFQDIVQYPAAQCSLDLQEVLDTYTFKLSKEVLNSLKSKKTLKSWIILKGIYLLKRIQARFNI